VAFVCRWFPTVSRNDQVPLFDVSEMISALSAGLLAELPHLVHSFDIAFFRSCPQQDPRLLAVSWE
jgi:hypothetical protein